jgi:GntR family transcriptional regulator
MLKRSPSLTEQAKAYIKERIVNDEFEEGRIPSEIDLADALGVSRTTVRDALSRLEQEGVIFRKQGAGTFVNDAGLQIKTRLEEIWTYESMLSAHGYTPTTHVFGLEEKPAPADTADVLGLHEGDKILVFTKLFQADESPVIVTVNQILAALVNQPYHQDDFQQPIYKFLSNFCRQHLTYYLSEIVPLMAPKWLVDALELPKQRSPILAFDEIGYNQDNEPVIKACSYFRDDLLRLRLIRREAIQ